MSKTEAQEISFKTAHSQSRSNLSLFVPLNAFLDFRALELQGFAVVL